MKYLAFFWSYISYRKGLLILLLTFSGIVAAAELYIPWIIMKAIDSVLEESNLAALNSWALQGLGMLALYYVLNASLARIEVHLMVESSYNLRRRLYRHIVSQAQPFFERYRTGELIHRVVTDTEEFEENSSDLFTELPFDFITVIGVTILMMLLDVKLAIFVIVFMIVNVIVTSYLGHPLLSIEKSIQKIGAGIVARLQETVSGIRTVQEFKNEQYELSLLNKGEREMVRTEIKEGKIESFMEPLSELMGLFGLGFVVWYGGHLIIAEQITVGALVAFIAYMDIISEPLGEVEGYYRDYMSSRAMAERLQDLLDDKECLPDYGDQVPSNHLWPVEVSGITFRHPKSERNILQDITFTAQPGEVIAITGRNGAGKSTLMDLLLRFYDPNSGSIIIGGVDLCQWDLTRWRNSIGVMSQDVFLFHGTILENIAYAQPEATPEKIMEIARVAGINKLAMKFPKGLNTVVGERGARLSGGERQRIALARIFLRQPRILMLDEPTAHLDGEALQDTLLMLTKLVSLCTTFIVTHQLETIQLADRVLFLDQGRLVADGTHQALMATNKSYAMLWTNERHRPIRKRRFPKRIKKRQKEVV